jgi:hypothetical protein
MNLLTDAVSIVGVNVIEKFVYGSSKHILSRDAVEIHQYRVTVHNVSLNIPIPGSKSSSLERCGKPLARLYEGALIFFN